MFTLTIESYSSYVNTFLRASFKNPNTCALSKNGINAYCDKMISETVLLNHVARLLEGHCNGVFVALSWNTSLKSSSNLTFMN